MVNRLVMERRRPHLADASLNLLLMLLGALLAGVLLPHGTAPLP